MPDNLNNRVVADEDMPHDAEDELDRSDLDVEMALFALSAQQDVGEPTEDLHLDQLSPSEKRILLAYMRQRLGRPVGGEETKS